MKDMYAVFLQSTRILQFFLRKSKIRCQTLQLHFSHQTVEKCVKRFDNKLDHFEID
jgi:hypothetical protein